jgi:putative addiction module component (TIGR02574 family)
MNAVLSAEINRLTPQEKLRLINELWDTLAQSPNQLPLPPAHEQALAEDQIIYQANPDADTSWAEVKQRIMK